MESENLLRTFSGQDNIQLFKDNIVMSGQRGLFRKKSFKRELPLKQIAEVRSSWNGFLLIEENNGAVNKLSIKDKKKFVEILKKLIENSDEGHHAKIFVAKSGFSSWNWLILLEILGFIFVLASNCDDRVISNSIFDCSEKIWILIFITLLIVVTLFLSKRAK